MGDERIPDIRKVKTKNGGDLLVDFNLLNPDQQSAAMQYTPAMMSDAPAPTPPPPPEPVADTLVPANGNIYGGIASSNAGMGVDAPMQAPYQPQGNFLEAIGQANIVPNYQKPVVQPPAAMVAPNAEEAAQAQAQHPAPQPAPEVVEDKMPSMGIAVTKGRGGGGGGNKKILAAMDAESDAVRKAHEAEGAGASVASDVYADALQKIEARNQEMEQKRAASEAAANEAMKRHDQAIEEVRSMKIDPEHYMNSRTTGQKIMMGFAIGLKHGNDSFLKDAINRDIDAQTAGIKTKMEYVNGLKVSVDMKKDMLHDLDQQAAMRSAQVLEAAKLKIESITARTTSETAKAEGDKVIAQLTQRQEAIKAQMAAQQAARAAAKVQYWINTPGGPAVVGQKEYLAQMNKEQEHKWKMEEAGAKAKGEKQELTVGGYTGFAPSKEAQTKVVETNTTAAEIERTVDEIKAIRKQMLLPGLTPTFMSTNAALLDAKKAQIFNKLRAITGAGAALSEAETKMIENMMGKINSPDPGGTVDFVLDDLKKTIRFKADTFAGGFGLRRNNAVSGGFKAE